MDAAVRYRIDAQDRLAEFDEEWRRFARANGAPELADEALLGRRLWDFVADAATAQVYRRLVERARDGREASFAFRCDSPDMKRWLRMTMGPAPAGGVAFEVGVVRLEPRARVAALDPAARRTGEPVVVCGWCKKFPAGGEWLEAEKALPRLGLMSEGSVPPLTHGLCPACEALMNAELDRA